MVYGLKTQYKCLSVKYLEQRDYRRIQKADPDEQNSCYRVNLIIRSFRFFCTLPKGVIYGLILVSYKP